MKKIKIKKSIVNAATHKSLIPRCLVCGKKEPSFYWVETIVAVIALCEKDLINLKEEIQRTLWSTDTVKKIINDAPVEIVEMVNAAVETSEEVSRNKKRSKK